MKTFVAIVVGTGKKNFVQSVHVTAENSRKAAAIVIRAIRQSRGNCNFQIALRPLESQTFLRKAGILEASQPVRLARTESAA